MTTSLILASGSEIRATLLRHAGVTFEQITAKVDEDALKQGLRAEGTTPRDMADALAEFKCAKVARKRPEAIVIGCDQTLDFEGEIINKPTSQEDAVSQLQNLRGKSHKLHSAMVLYYDAGPIWRHIGTARLTLHDLSDGFIEDYVDRNWPIIRHSLGGYVIEGEGIRLMSRVEGDTPTIQGLPLVPLLSYLAQRGTLPL